MKIKLLMGTLAVVVWVTTSGTFVENAVHDCLVYMRPEPEVKIVTKYIEVPKYVDRPMEVIKYVDRISPPQIVHVQVECIPAPKEILTAEEYLPAPQEWEDKP